MKIMVIGKYPPIEGGVSASTYWTCRILAEVGHEVHVVTNALEVEPQFRMWLQPEDEIMLKTDFTGTGKGRVFVHTPEPIRPEAYIPWTNPYVTRLTGLALSVAKSYGCDLIYAYYYEPYGVVAAIVSSWLGVPYRVRHAGSDIGRLALIPELGEVYREVLGRAERVITSGPRHKERLEKLGAKSDSLLFDDVYSVPTDYFNPKASPLDIKSISDQTDRWCEEIGYHPELRERIGRINSTTVDFTVPFVGVYGKIGETKGSFDLLEAFTKCRNVNLVAMVNGYDRPFSQFLGEIENKSIIGRVTILPFLPHWRVPSFIRACRAVCFLERKFPITFHTPMVPREVLACGGCLVCSQEAANKSSFAANVADWKNMVIVNPEDHAGLAIAIQKLVKDESLARTIGYYGHNLSSSMENFAQYRTTRSNLIV